VVPHAAASLFGGLFWLVLALSDALLGLVDVNVISDLWDENWFVLIVSGAVLGLALAVVNELSDYVSPYLILRLLRLLLPVVLVVVAVFLAMVPIRGLEEVFGSLSAAATLMAMGLAAATLVSTAVDEAASEEVKSPWMRGATRALALLMPVLAGLACYAIWIRVEQYGWTPPRLTAAAGGVVMLGYGVLYALVALGGGDWPARVRTINTYLALAVIAMAALWLSPVLNAERISANNQVARYMDGKTHLDVLDLETLHRDWGVAGQRAIARLQADPEAPASAALKARIATLLAESGSTSDRRALREAREISSRERLAATITVLPEGARLPDGLMEALRPFEMERMLEACARVDAAGQPGCAAVVADFLPDLSGDEVAVFQRLPGGDTRTDTFAKGRGGRYEQLGRLRGLVAEDGFLPDASLETLLEGFEIVPVPRFGLRMGQDVFVMPH